MNSVRACDVPQVWHRPLKKHNRPHVSERYRHCHLASASRIRELVRKLKSTKRIPKLKRWQTVQA